MLDIENCLSGLFNRQGSLVENWSYEFSKSDIGDTLLVIYNEECLNGIFNLDDKGIEFISFNSDKDKKGLIYIIKYLIKCQRLHIDRSRAMKIFNVMCITSDEYSASRFFNEIIHMDEYSRG